MEKSGPAMPTRQRRLHQAEEDSQEDRVLHPIPRVVQEAHLRGVPEAHHTKGVHHHLVVDSHQEEDQLPTKGIHHPMEAFLHREVVHLTKGVRHQMEDPLHPMEDLHPMEVHHHTWEEAEALHPAEGLDVSNNNQRLFGCPTTPTSATGILPTRILPGTSAMPTGSLSPSIWRVASKGPFRPRSVS